MASTTSRLCLLDLTGDILLLILDHTFAHDFENLVLSCKHLHMLAQRSHLSQHNALRRKYGHYDIKQVTQVSHDTKSVVRLLLAIADEPQVAAYIVHLDLGHRECFNNLKYYRAARDEDIVAPKVDSQGAGTFRDGVESRLRELMCASKHLAALEFDPEAWLEKIIADENQFESQVDYATAFLLSLLPNLESLLLSRDWTNISAVAGGFRHEQMKPRDEQVAAFVHLLITHANTPDLTCQPLQKLRLLHPVKDVDEQGGAELEAIFPFLALNSLVEASHERGVLAPDDAEGCNDAARRLYPILGRNLETLTLDDVAFHHERVADVFGHMHKLRKLRINYSSKDYEIGGDWQIDSFVHALMTAVGENLEELSLTAGLLGPPDGLELIPNGTSLAGFVKLRSLVLDTRLFIVSSAETSNYGGGTWTEPEDVDVAMLADILPASLECFTLHLPATLEDVACMEGLFLDFLEQKETVLSNLRSVNIILTTEDVWQGPVGDSEEVGRIEESVRTFAQRHGVHCEVMDRRHHLLSQED